ncbi:MAG TPA: OB-fold domain-containing protein [Rhizomicrobium sp.]|nr:OB-fold domain-containing protein [Rhizomicrobium sp.]
MTVDRNHNAVFENRVDFPFWDGLEKSEVRIQRCDHCKQWLWPAEWRCGNCGSWDLNWEQVSGDGTVYAWERTHYPFMPAYKELLPYVNILASLTDAGGSRVVGLLVGPSENIRIGAPVKAVIQPASARTCNLPILSWRLADAGDTL